MRRKTEAMIRADIARIEWEERRRRQESAEAWRKLGEAIASGLRSDWKLFVGLWLGILIGGLATWVGRATP